MKKNNKHVTAFLTATVNNQLTEKNIVVWFDPEQLYKSLIYKENFPNANLFVYDPRKGFLDLRRQLEPIWKSIEPPKLLIYVPLSQEKTFNALIEFMIAGVIVQPGQQPLECNTRLSTVAKQALSEILPASKLEKVIIEAENGKLSLSDLDEIASRHKDAHWGPLVLIFKSENFEDICLQFLTSKDLDREITSKNVISNLVELLNNELEAHFSENLNLDTLRDALSRHLLLSEFIFHLGKEVSTSVITFPSPDNKTVNDTIKRLNEGWRSSEKYVSSYILASQKIDTELSIQNLDFPIELLEKLYTFPGIDLIIQSKIEKDLIDNPKQKYIDIAYCRQSMFWANQIPELKLHWQLITGAGEVIIASKKIRAINKKDLSANQIINKYTQKPLASGNGEIPWYVLDTTFRRLERDEHNFDFDPQRHQSLQKLIVNSRLAYINAIHEMTENFIDSFQKENFHISEIIQQTSIFHDFISPNLENQKIAYILVDAFRYEMAMDLFEQIQTEWECRIYPAIATPPTITEVGMAALMPGSERGLSFSPAGAGKIGVLVSDTILKNRADRVKHLELNFEKTIVLELHQIAPLKDKKVINSLNNANLIVVTATDEIDKLWETQPEIARRLHDDVFNQLRRGIRNLLNSNVQKIVITSDHGFLAGEDLMVGIPMDPPGGETIDLHRRVWIGWGGSDTPNCLRKPISAFGIGGDLELVTPIGLGCFKVVGGSTKYYHGGLSLQEMVIPILTINPGQNFSLINQEPGFDWEIKLGSQQISSRFFSVTISGVATDLLAMPPSIKAELRCSDQIVSTPVASTYGLEEITKDIKMVKEEGSTKLIPNTLTLLIDELPENISTLDLLLVNSETGIILSKIENIPITITF